MKVQVVCNFEYSESEMVEWRRGKWAVLRMMVLVEFHRVESITGYKCNAFVRKSKNFISNNYSTALLRLFRINKSIQVHCTNLRG